MNISGKSAANSSIGSKRGIECEDEVDKKYRLFKQFDMVQDHSDHYFSDSVVAQAYEFKLLNLQPTSFWMSRVQREWKILQYNLPETIYVRAYEERMDILRALIVGPAGTPYHDGLFFFDIFFPPKYPDKPPKVHYHARGLRLNPNLYECGKVCLSLLNTWRGSGCERWNPLKSTILQVVVSIQALILNSRPYFNEPLTAWRSILPFTENLALAYNEHAFLLSCKSMCYTLRRPPMHFEDFVVWHFRKHGHGILHACRAYMNGAQIGSEINRAHNASVQGGNRCPSSFKESLEKSYEKLMIQFRVDCVECAEFVDQIMMRPPNYSPCCNFTMILMVLLVFAIIYVLFW
ncbi:ubiquitin-conjugating enzyme E2 38 [Canna indica]|uniref:E2 ubiquitin-conjugating enzyme n=1 Tax=Canna indica TaxID=4628 RepID=A0AAQ3PZ16_9LILI|nr:ubiquitin-conjugating enzyme E2 38 [Canna indica]